MATGGAIAEIAKAETPDPIYVLIERAREADKALQIEQDKFKEKTEGLTEQGRFGSRRWRILNGTSNNTSLFTACTFGRHIQFAYIFFTFFLVN